MLLASGRGSKLACQKVARQSYLECGGKRSATPLWIVCSIITTKAPSPLCSAGALQMSTSTTCNLGVQTDFVWRTRVANDFDRSLPLQRLDATDASVVFATIDKSE